MTEIHDLRSYLDTLDEAGELTRITEPVSVEHELADVAAALARSGGPAPLFEHVVLEDGSRSPWPIFASAVASHRRAGLALGCEVDDAEALVDRMEHALEASSSVPPVRRERAAWHDNVVTGGAELAERLAALPIPTHSTGDGGAFITGAVTVTRDPIERDGVRRGNLSYNRMLRFEDQAGPVLGFNVNEWRDVGTFMKSRPDPDEPFPVALAIGLDPAISIAAGVRTDLDELLIAGAIRGAGVAVCSAVTSDIDVPAEAEIVIEGLIRPAERIPEGPLAEFHGYHGEEWPSPSVEVMAISWRNDPIYQTIIPGWYEHVYIGNVLPREPLLRRFVRHLDKTAVVHIPPYGNGFLAVVQIDRDNPGQPKNLAMAAMTAHINIRNVVVVDRDIDIHDPTEVMWAITNRVDWGLDTFTVPGAQGHEMDPTADTRGVGTKLGIDATYKRERREYGERVSYPPVDLARYLSP